MNAQKLWRTYVQTNYWIILCCWLFVSGRWFVFREAPTWFLESIINEPLQDASDQLLKFLAEARKELLLRKDKNKV
jgi:hypothetical protein